MDESGLPVIMTPKDVCSVLGVSRNTGYKIIHSKGFPAFQVGNLYRVHRNQFLDWLDKVSKNSSEVGWRN